MRRIAIIKVHGMLSYDSYGDPYNTRDQLVQHCTEFEEVSDEDFDLLQEGLRRRNCSDNCSYLIIEEVTSPKFIEKTVSDYKKALLKQQEDMRKQEEERLKKAEEAKLKREKKKLEKLAKDRENFKKMAAEMGLTVVEE